MQTMVFFILIEDVGKINVSTDCKEIQGKLLEEKIIAELEA